MKVWKQTTNTLTMDEHELKHIFLNGVFPIYKLFVIYIHDMYLGDMIEIITKKEPCIKILSAMKHVDHASLVKPITETQTKVEANHVTCKKMRYFST